MIFSVGTWHSARDAGSRMSYALLYILGSTVRGTRDATSILRTWRLRLRCGVAAMLSASPVFSAFASEQNNALNRRHTASFCKQQHASVLESFGLARCQSGSPISDRPCSSPWNFAFLQEFARKCQMGSRPSNFSPVVEARKVCFWCETLQLHGPQNEDCNDRLCNSTQNWNLRFAYLKRTYFMCAAWRQRRCARCE